MKLLDNYRISSGYPLPMISFFCPPYFLLAFPSEQSSVPFLPEHPSLAMVVDPTGILAVEFIFEGFFFMDVGFHGLTTFPL